MEFDANIHTKAYLLANVHILKELASSSDEFALSEHGVDFEILNTRIEKKGDDSEGSRVAHYLATKKEWYKQNAHQDLNILKIADDYGRAVAHLMTHSREWLQSPAAKSMDVLGLTDKFGYTVAHYFAEYESFVSHEFSKKQDVLSLKNNSGWSVAHYLAKYKSWLSSEAANNYEILQITNAIGITVAHSIASEHPEWLNSKAANDLKILLMADNKGRTVASKLITHPESLQHKILFHKQALTSTCEDLLLVEKIAQLHGNQIGYTLSELAIALIEQGAAFKHSLNDKSVLDVSILDKTKTLISECPEPLIGFRYAIAVYSTCHHEKERFKALKLDGHEIWDYDMIWAEATNQAEGLIKKHIMEHPELLTINHQYDYFCQPAEDLIRKIESEKNFMMVGSLCDEISHSESMNNTLF